MDIEQAARFQEQVAQELARLDISYKGAVATTSRYGGYHEAAAVLVSFDPDRLQRVPGSPAEDIEELLANCTLGQDGRGHTGWSLLHSVRKDVLKQLGTRERMQQALSANPSRPDIVLQTMVEAYIRGDAPALDVQNTQQLAATFQVVEWLEGILSDVPPQDAVTLQMEREGLLQPLEDLAGTNFRGRQKELKQLREYVEVLPPESALSAVLNWCTKGVKEVLDLHQRPPLLIYGPGGMGKSTLLARFVLDHARLDEKLRFPFVFLDLERPELKAEEPLTLLVEAVRQLGTQYPHARQACERIRADWQGQLADAARRRSAVRAAAQSAPPLVRLPRERFLETFRNLLETMNVSGRPLLFVLDTFEEVQYRSRAFLQELWSFLVELQQRIPRLRVVVAGRAPVAEYNTEDLPLGELDEDAAQGYLRGHGVTDRALAARLVAKLGGNPLTLRLASELLATEGIEAVEAGAGLDQLTIQRQLYRRILNRIHDKDVRQLAHPGLVLRYLTPAVILEVLADPCGVQIEDLAHARQLFEKLRAEDSLVMSASGDDAVRHRPELRRIMLPLLEKDQPDKVAAIHARAVEHYQSQDGPIARAEEIYHRLSLRQSTDEIDRRWTEGLEPFLSNALDDLPAVERLYLATRLGVETDHGLRIEAVIAIWQRDAERRARELLGLGRSEDALSVLRERPDRPAGTSLDGLEATALQNLGRLDEARMILEKAVAALTGGRDTDLLSRYLLMAALLDMQASRHDEARRALATAEAVLASGAVAEPIRQLEIAAARLQLDMIAGAPHETVDAQQARVRSLLASLSDEQLSSQSALLRRIAGLLSKEDGPLLARIIRIVGLGTLGHYERRPLGRALAAWDRQISKQKGEAPGVLARASQLRPLEELSDTWQEFAQASESRRIASVLSRLLENYEPLPAVLKTIVEILHLTLTAPDDGTREGEGESNRQAPPERRAASDVRLSASHARELHGALLDAFPNVESIRSTLRFRLDRNVDAITFDQSVAGTLTAVIERARKEGWVADLVAAAREAKPDHPQLQAIAEKLGLGSAAAREVSRVLRRADQFIDINEWRRHLGQIEGRVCRVEVEVAKGQLSYATGFLVGPNLLITVYHPFEPLLKGQASPPPRPPVRFRFDYKVLPGGRTLNPGTVYQLASQQWLVDFSEYSPADLRPGELPDPDHLDYALLRLDGFPGGEPVGGERAEPDAPNRGWIEMPREPYEFVPDTPLYIMQHPAAGPLKLAAETRSIVGVNANGTRVMYRTVTESGSAGAPCFSSSWELVAMHHAYRMDPDAKVNQGIPVNAIVARLERRNLLGALEDQSLL